MSDEKQRRAMMVSHLLDLSSAMLRSVPRRGHPIRVTTLARDMLTYTNDPLPNYREALILADFTSEQIDAAVASIQRGERPEDSLPGRIRRARDKAAAEAGERRVHGAGFSPRTNLLDGEAHAFDRMLEMLGVKP